MEASRQRDVADYEQLRSEALLIGLGQGSGPVTVRPRCVAHGVMVNRIAATTAERASRGGEPQIAAGSVRIDHLASDPGAGSCMIRALRPTI